MSVGTKLLQAAAGGGSDPVYVDDVFSTHLWTGDSSGSRSINNGIDLDGEGGLVWIKGRTSAYDHALYDTARGVTKEIYSNKDDRSSANSNALTSFNSNGFNIGSGPIVNNNSDTYVAWSFRKAEKFFDIVTYTGDGTTSHTINHNLGSVPGMIIVKRTDLEANWNVWHRSSPLGGNGKYNDLMLYHSNAAGNSSFWPTTHTSTQFFLGDSDSAINASGGTYVAYLFGHNEAEYGQNSDEAIIYCGKYTGSGSTGKFVDLGFEPQWVFVKNLDASTPWVLIDIMRGMPVDGDGVRLLADQSAAEVSSASYFAPRPTGMEVTQQNTYVNTSGQNYVYMAIRRPNKPASEFAATDVFGVANATTNAPLFVSGFPVDGGFYHQTTNTQAMYVGSRLQGTKYMLSYSTAAEVTNNDHKWDFMDGWYNASLASTEYVSYMFRRAKGFFDVVTYTGNGSARTLTHNLGVVPEFMIAKSRTESQPWVTYDAANGATKYARIDSQNAVATYSGIWNDTAPTSSVFSTGGDAYINKNGQNYIIYLFATVAGISKVGSYTGTGSDLNVDCGFSAGARFVLIKRTDSTGDWYVYDSVRGIVAGNDPYFLLNSGAVDVTNTDYIDPLSSGFTITSSAPAGLNASSGTYIFLAIA